MEVINLLKPGKTFPTCKAGDHSQSDLEDTFNVIVDVEIVLVSQIGPGAAQFLLSKGIQPYMVADFIDVALNTLSTILNPVDQKK